MSQNTKTYKDAFALFDKKGSGKIPVEHLGDLLRAVGQNPTLAEIAELQKSIKSDEFDFDTYQKIIERPDGFKPLGLPEDYIKGFQVFDKDQTGYIGVGELRYILTSIGEKLSDSEVDELLKGVNVTPDGNVDYVEFVKSILDQ
ncbi:Piso0_002033 [Millerozyma farinosa CBS 7064]|uniref:Piso0_002033 protein n=1 Tax=Pichia sorbitophila (strain ATCC MYA-4447 / BCRC 22081 / CBS 7064 / NBRC 10061 / NRRL Y-12695) TaxID=559304 RepID=G8YMC7_PICSO|nr:Piso0_002033 [Millerozyma farinosa CBS 7064]